MILHLWPYRRRNKDACVWCTHLTVMQFLKLFTISTHWLAGTQRCHSIGKRVTVVFCQI